MVKLFKRKKISHACQELNLGLPSNSPVIIQDASVNRAILQHCFFWFSNTGADAAIAILLPTLKHFSWNGAADWSTMCFCCERVLQKQ